MNFVNILLWAFTIFLEGKTGRSSQARDSSASSSFQRELRWLIEKVHPISQTSSTETSQKSRDSQIWKTRKAFAAAERAIGKSLGKRSSNRDFLKRVTSLFKEKEDSSIKSSVCRPSIDLAFAIDGCGRKPFHICIKFVKDVIRVSSFPKTNTRVGVIVYSRKARLLFSFNYFKNVDDLFSALDRLHFTSKQPGKPENIGAALSKAHDTLFSRSRGGVPKVLVVITGARANDDIINPSKRLRKEGVIIYGVGFGNDFEKSQLEIISSQPVHEHVFLAEPYLSNHITGVLRNHFCQEQADAVREDSIQRYQGPAKVVFLLDGSGDISFKEIQSYRLFVKDVYENLNIPPSGITFGLLECGSRHYTQKHILTRTVQSSNMLELSLEKLVPANGSCKLGQSLQMINMNIFKKLPRGTPKALVVVLAGKSLDDATNAAKELSKKGVKIVAFGAGGDADMRQLVSITDSPLYAFNVPMFKYLPSMSSTVVGFLDEVTEPKYLNNKVASSDLPESSNEVKQTGYLDSNDNTDPNDIGEPPYNDDDLLQSLPPILDQLKGHEPDSWISALESDSMKQDDSHPSQNVLPSENTLSAGVLDVRPTQAHVGGQVAASQSDWNFAGSKVTPTTGKEENHFHDDSNAQKAQGNTPSSNQGPGKLPPNNTSPVSPVTSAQGVVNGNSATPSYGTNGANSLAPVTSPSQVGGNQGKEVPGANSSAPVTSPSQVGGAPSSGTNGANSPAPITSPSQVGGNQGKEVPGGVSPPAGGAINPNKAGTSGNSGTGAGSIENTVGVSTNLAPNGPVQVVQTQLLPIPVLPIQAIPIQALSPIQSPAGRNQQAVLVVNQPQISQGNSNETNNNSEVGSKGENNQIQGVPTSRPAPTGGNQEGQNETGQGAPVLPTTRQSNPYPSASVNVASPKPATNKPPPITYSAPGSPSRGRITPSSSKSSKPENGNSNPLRTPPESKSPAPHESQSGKLGGSKNKPTPDLAAAGSPATGITSSEKPNGAVMKPTQQPPAVLCQIICGPYCCLLTSKPTTKKSTIPTSKTSVPTTRAKSTKPTTESAPEVVAGPPIALRYPHQPGWLPHGALSVPQEPIPILHRPLPAPLDSASEPISSSIQLPMYMTLPPATASPEITSHQGSNHPFFVGECHDVHPDCDSFVMNGMCDQSIPFKEIFNVLELCMQSCGVCNSFIKHGQDVIFDLHNKGKQPEDLGFPEYSKKFLKRQVRAIQTTQETR